MSKHEDGITTHHKKYDRKRYSWRQVRDSIEGSSAIKRANQVYLPMPSGMRFNDATTPDANNNPSNFSESTNDYDRQYVPWQHPNPAYSAYLQRARFPDMTSHSLTGLVGISTKTPPQVNLPSQLQYLEESATPDGFTLIELFEFCVSEIFQTGKVVLVLDVRKDNTFYISTYTAEANINWRVECVDGKRIQTKSVFEECDGVEGLFTSDGEDSHHIKYFLATETEDTPLTAWSQTFIDGKPQGKPEELSKQGKTIEKLPIVNIGSLKNTPDPDAIPLLGISDIATTIYRKDADLSQAQFLTCNPTLFLFGIAEQDMPKVIGSTVAVGIPNPEGKAEYPKTDTSALEHIRKEKQDLFNEAIQYGAALVGRDKKSAESAEALALRKEANGANLVNVVRRVGEALTEILNMAAKWTGVAETAEFLPSMDFAEHTLTPQGITSLISAWVQGGISQDTLLDNLRDADIVSNEVTNEQEKARVAAEEEDRLQKAADAMKLADENNTDHNDDDKGGDK